MNDKHILDAADYLNDLEERVEVLEPRQLLAAGDGGEQTCPAPGAIPPDPPSPAPDTFTIAHWPNSKLFANAAAMIQLPGVGMEPTFRDRIASELRRRAVWFADIEDNQAAADERISTRLHQLYPDK